MPLTPEQRSLRSRIAGYASHLNYSGAERTAVARAAWRDHWAADIRAEHPDLSDAEITRRAQIARRLWYAKLAYKSAGLRAKRKAAAGQKSAAAKPEVGRDRPTPAA